MKHVIIFVAGIFVGAAIKNEITRAYIKGAKTMYEASSKEEK